MTNIERVVELLRDYLTNKRLLAIIQMEIEHFSGVTYDEAIEALALASAEGERVQSSSISDKTGRVALMFRDIADKDNQAALSEMVSELRAKQHEIEPLEYCVGLLASKQREVIRCIYFEGWTWVEACDHLGLNQTTLARTRRKAIKELALMLGARLLAKAR